MPLEGTWPGRLSPDRVGRSLEALVDTRAEFAQWFTARTRDPRFARFASHLRILRTVLDGMLAAVQADLESAGSGAGLTVGTAYERCRAAEARISLVRRTHAWYAEKYDQRLDPRLVAVLQSADEVVRSCWSEPFAVAGVVPPAGPLVHLDPRFDALATPRVSVPPDLRAPGDAVIGEFVRELPIPVVALPAASAREPWWLVLAAHETGHHVQRDLAPELEPATRAVLLEATQGSPAADEVVPAWQRWAAESFADAFAVLMVGAGSVWAVEELQHATPSRMVTEPRMGDRYPPPAVRSALLGELARLAGATDAGPDAAQVGAWLQALPAEVVDGSARRAVTSHLAVVPAVAAALLTTSARGQPLPRLCGWSAARFAERGDVARWATVMTSPNPVVTGRSARPAARLALAGGVAAFRDLKAGPVVETLRANLLRVLPTCGPPGVLATAPAEDLSGLSDRLAKRLLAVTPDQLDGRRPEPVMNPGGG